MASKEIERVKGAVETLKLVASSLHTPLDVSELEAAVAALEDVKPAAPAVGGSSAPTPPASK